MTGSIWSYLVSPKSDDDDDDIRNHQTDMRNQKTDEDLEQV